MKFIGIIKTKGSIVLWEYIKPKYSFRIYLAPYTGDLQKWEIPVWFGRVTLDTGSDNFLCDSDSETKFDMSPSLRENFLSYINKWEFDLVWYIEGVWVVYEGYFKVTTSWGGRYFDPVLKSDYERIKDQIR